MVGESDSGVQTDLQMDHGQALQLVQNASDLASHCGMYALLEGY